MNKFIAGLMAITVSFHLWAGANEVLINALEQAEREYQQKQEEKEMREAAYLELFGYIPTEEEIDLMLRVAMAECGNTEPIEGIERVIEVIANRCQSSRFPQSIKEVCYQRYQFQTVTKGTIWRLEVNDRVQEAWDNVLCRGECIDKEVLFFTAGGYNRYCIPMYKLGNHYFGR